MEIKQITAEYRDHMGSDLSVVNAARASFGKDSTWEECSDGRRKLKLADVNLIRFLATGFRTKDWDALLDEVLSAAFQSPDYATQKSELTEILQHYKKSAQHWAPFAHPHMQIRMKLPIFLARQFVKHQIGGTWSEESRRYMSSEPEFWFPEEWHGRPEDIKQGSDGLVAAQRYCHGATQRVVEHALTAYQQMLGEGVAPEEARIVLPLNTMTTVVWTGSLLFWSRVCNQRVDSHAQLAAQELAKLISDIIQPLYPVSWDALT